SWHFSRKCQNDLSAGAVGGADRKLAPVRFDDSLSNCHAQPSAFRLGSEKGLENPLPLLGRQTGSVVVYAHPEHRSALYTPLPDGDRNDGRSRTGSEGILEDVAKDLLKPELIDRAAQVHALDLLP